MSSSFTEHLWQDNPRPGDSRGGSLLEQTRLAAEAAAEYDPRSAAAATILREEEARQTDS